jgi:hypothetical protein
MASSALHYEPPVRRSARFTPLDYGLFEEAVTLVRFPMLDEQKSLVAVTTYKIASTDMVLLKEGSN